ncbi:hypothetical protein ACFC00_31245 [Streptomyces adustus]|uniref:hypothetical protein n=1 Tax=Streptomyces adustus TaxID=1609272 RepID=UPI0035D5BA54
MKPRRVAVPKNMRPTTARVRPEPLGVCLIIAPWDHLLTLNPLVETPAAGNAADVKASEAACATSVLIAANAGQTCVAPDCVLVAPAAWDPLPSAFPRNDPGDVRAQPPNQLRLRSHRQRPSLPAPDPPTGRRWRRAAGRRLLAAGCWLLAAGCWRALRQL